MLAEEQKLQWCGIDMRPRWRRRVAVVATYALYLFLIWSHTRLAYGLAVSLGYLAMLLPLLFLLEDVEVGMKIVVRVITVALVAIRGYDAWSRPSHLSGLPAVFYASLFLTSSVLGWNSLVGNANRSWMAEAIRNSSNLSWRKQRHLARSGFAVGLDGFAWYEYGMRFRKLTAEQQSEIEELHRTNPRGKWMRNRETVLFDDERMRREDDSTRAKVQKLTSGVLFSAAFVFTIALADEKTISRAMVISALWTLAALVWTLRQAIPLWTEDDPRAVAGEIELVEGARV
jgi:hypothetical protein